jgi:hypothetical protein
MESSGRGRCRRSSEVTLVARASELPATSFPGSFKKLIVTFDNSHAACMHGVRVLLNTSCSTINEGKTETREGDGDQWQIVQQ